MNITITTEKKSVTHDKIKEIKVIDYGGIPFLALIYSSGISKKLYRLDYVLEIFEGKEIG